MKALICSGVFLLFVIPVIFAQPAPGVKASITKLEKDIPYLMEQADIPGMSIALIRDGKIVWNKEYGVMNADTKQPVTENTIFEAASLTKMVYAYAVMKLVDQGKLDLDVPLNKYFGSNYDVGDDIRMDSITARRVLSHTTGFPNWRQNEKDRLPIQFSPGSKFSYSGEGFVYLSKVVEKITGIPSVEWVEQTVLKPLGMNKSMVGFTASAKENAVYRHNSVGKVTQRNEWPGFNAAACLRTNAVDYGRFVIALLNGEGLSKKTWQQMMSPQINVKSTSPEVFWGLGVGLEQSANEKAFWHWGDQGDSKAWITADLIHKNAIVYFANSENGLSITREILADGIGGNHQGADWLAYDRYNSPARNLLKSILAEGAQTSMKTYLTKVSSDKNQQLTEAQINTLGYQLMGLKKYEDAIIVFAQNTIDYPNSSNAWDSYAEAFMNKGDKELAIRYYEKTLELNPASKNAADMLKKLKQ